MLAVRCQYFCEPELGMDVPAHLFTPPPKVDSAFVLLPMRDEPAVKVRSEEDFFRMAGAALENYKIVGLKSMNHFRGYFAPLADAIITADTPGARPANLNLYPYQNVNRPIYPLDADTQY